MKILITGGTGLIGKELGRKLKQKEYSVAVLSRHKNHDTDIQTYLWNPEKNEIENGAIETADYIIHLAGANISEKNWKKERKKVIVDSRVKTADFLYSKIKKSGNILKAFISASAVNYYGTVTSDKIFTEDDPPANDFLGITCRKWEESAFRFQKLGIRTVIIRTGVVLSGKGGALSKMQLPVRLGIGSPVGSGRQYLPWIHIDDLCNIYIKAIEDSKMDGAYNAVAPDHITNKDFMKTIARVQKMPFWAPKVPAFVMKALYGKMADILLKGSRVSSARIREAGYTFRFSSLESAIGNLIS